MTQDEISDRILRGLYDRRNAEPTRVVIRELAIAMGVADEKGADRAAEYLQEKGLVRAAWVSIQGFAGEITAEGVRLVELAGAESPMAHLGRLGIQVEGAGCSGWGPSSSGNRRGRPTDFEKLADHILRGLAATESATGLDDIVQIARAVGVTDRPRIERIAETLDSAGMFRAYRASSETIMAGLSGEAERLLEEVGPEGSPMQHLRGRRSNGVDCLDPAPSTHVTVFGDLNHSNLMVHSPYSRQSAGHDVKALVSALVEAVRGDTSLSEEKKANAAEDAESLKDELEKDRPNWRVVDWLLKGIGAVGTAAEVAGKIRGALGLWPAGP